MRRKIFYLIPIICLPVIIVVIIYYFGQTRKYYEGKIYKIPVNLTASQFQVQEDLEFTEKFKQYADNDALQWIRKKTLGDIIGAAHLKKLLKSAIEVGPNQYPGLYKRLQLCTEILNMESPRTFVVADPAIKARIFNHDSPTLVINSGMLETLSPEEVQFILGHQLGHIKCDHILPKTAVMAIMHVIKNYLPEDIADLAVPASGLALMRWTRDAEISADRAGLICCQDEDVAVKSLIRLLSGLSDDSYEKYGSPDIESFIEQKRESEKKSLLDITSLVSELDESAGCHSYIGTRVVELRAYARSPEYSDIFKKNE